MKRAVTSAALLLALVLVLPGIASAGRGRADINDVYVVHLILDGANLEAFDSALRDGRMPSVKELFHGEGAVFTHGLSLFPSTSTTAYQAYVTGLFPGHAGIPHLERFDRRSERVIGYLTASGFDTINDDLINLRALTNPDVAELQPPTTVFELLDGHPTKVIYSSFSRGASSRHPRRFPLRALWSTYVSGNPENVDVLAMRRLMRTFQRPIEELPRFTVVGLYSADILGHLHGPMSGEVMEVFSHFDLFLKEFLALLEERGIRERSYIVLSSDHGMHETGRLFRIVETLRERGIKLRPTRPPRRDYSFYVATRGVVSSHIYIRHDGGFEPLTDPGVARRVPAKDGEEVDLIEFLQGLEAVEFIAVRAGDRSALLFDGQGNEARIDCYDIRGADYCSYDTSAGDPLGYSESGDRRLKAMVDSGPHPTTAWRDASAGERWPDAVVNLSQIFHDGRAGDIYVTAGGRYGFRKVKMGNHGGIIEGDMRTPFMMAGPTVPRGTFGAMRPVDLYPLLLEWFGLEVPAQNYDGRNPFLRAVEEDPRLTRIAAAEHRAARGMPVAPDRRLAALAETELRRRERRVERLSSLLEEMRSRRGERGSDIRYEQDHIDIVGRSLAWAIDARDRMDSTARSLSGKGGPR